MALLSKKYLRSWLGIIFLSFPIFLIIINLGIPSYPLLSKLIYPILAGVLIPLIGNGLPTQKVKFLSTFFLSITIFVIEWLEWISYFFQGDTFNLPFFYYFNTSALQEVGSYKYLLYLPILCILIYALVDYRLCNSNPQPSSIFVLTMFLLATVIIPNSATKFVEGYIRSTSNVSEEDILSVEQQLRSNFVNVEITKPADLKANIELAHPKNLVLIYLESLESSYLDENRFPDLVPNINNARTKGLDFTNIVEFPDTGFSIGSMFSSQCSMPLAINANDSIFQNSSLSMLTCLGDITKKAGYYQVSLGGATKKFAGLDMFYTSHGFDEVLGYDEFVNQVGKSAYESDWGLFDDTIFKIAEEKYVSLTENGKPFFLTFYSLDNNHINRISSSCPVYLFSNKLILQQVHCTDFLLGQFLRAIEKMPDYRDTVIWIMSDHLTMKSDLFKNESDRKLLMFALNTGRVGNINIQGATFDVPHTILDILSIKHNANFALGQSLLKPEMKNRYQIYKNGQAKLLRDYLALLARREQKINICNQDGINFKNKNNYIASLGGSKVRMTYNGLESLPIDNIFLVKADLHGSIEEYKILPMDDAVQYVGNSPNALYLMVTRDARLPFNLAKDVYPENSWRWYFGNPSTVCNNTSCGLKGYAESLANVVIPKNQCWNVIENNQKSDPVVEALIEQMSQLQNNIVQKQAQIEMSKPYLVYPSVLRIVSSTGDHESLIQMDQDIKIISYGITLAVIEPSAKSFSSIETFDVYNNSDAQLELINALQSLPNGSIFVLFTHNNSNLKWSPVDYIKSKLESMGAKSINLLEKQPYIFIGVVGAPTIIERTDSKSFLEMTLSPQDFVNLMHIYPKVTLQSASSERGDCYLKIDNVILSKPGRGIMMVVIDTMSGLSKFNKVFDTYNSEESIKAIMVALKEIKRGDVLALVGCDSITTASGLPKDFLATLELLGADHASKIGFRTPYIFLVKVGTPYRWEKYWDTEGVIYLDLGMQDLRNLFSPNMTNMYNYR